MSSIVPNRTRLLDAARALFEERGPHAVGMDEIAKAAGFSRQAAYLHFRSKSGLLLALVEHIDSGRDVNDQVERLWAAGSARASLGMVAQLAAHTNAEVHRIAMALDAARRWDADFRTAWDDRMRRRLSRYRRLAAWLAEEGALGKGWTPRQAAALLWAITSVATYELLVVDMRLSQREYVRVIATTLAEALEGPLKPADRLASLPGRRRQRETRS